MDIFRRQQEGFPQPLNVSADTPFGRQFPRLGAEIPFQDVGAKGQVSEILGKLVKRVILQTSSASTPLLASNVFGPEPLNTPTV